MKGSRSLNRLQVDETLAKKGTDLEAFVAGGRAQAKTYEQIYADLQATTNVPFSIRTFYRWIHKERQSA